MALLGGLWVAMGSSALAAPVTLSFVYGVDASESPVTVIDKSINGQTIRFSSTEITQLNDGLGILPFDFAKQAAVLTITAPNGYSFDLTSFQAEGNTSFGTISSVLADGSAAPTVSFSVIGPLGSLSTVNPFTPSINDVTSLTINVADPTSFQDFVIDDFKLIGPAAKATNAVMSDDPGDDFIVNLATQTFSGTLSTTLDAGARVQVSYDDGANWRDASSFQSGSANWSDADVTLAGSGVFQVRTINATGGTSTPFKRAYTLDQTAPSIALSKLSLSSDTGASPSDFVTKTTAQTITATLSAALASGDQLQGSIDDGLHWNDITDMITGSTLVWPGLTLTEGSSALQFRFVDFLGNTSSAQRQPYTLDSTPPNAPATPSLASTSDSGISDSDRITSAPSPTVIGTAESGSTVIIYSDNNPLGTTFATGGAWNFTAPFVSDGTYQIKATATDLAGNVSADSATTNITIDRQPPSITSVGVPANGTYHAGQTLTFSVNFNEIIHIGLVPPPPSLPITIGGSSREASYVSGSGSSTLTFSYTVTSGDLDTDGIGIVGQLNISGGALWDLAGNMALLNFNAVGNTSGVLVDGNSKAPNAPAFLSATPGDGQITLTWNAPDDNGKPISSYTVTGNPSGTCTVSGTTSCTISGLTNGSTYEFTVTATNEIGPSAASQVIRATPIRTTASGTVAGMTGTATVTIAGGATCTLASANFDAALPPDAPTGATQPAGVFSFRATGCPGETVSVTLAYPEPLPANVHFMKYGPPAAGKSPAWFELPSTAAKLSDDRRTVQYAVTDDQAGDSDTTTAGAVEDPFAPMLLAATPTASGAVSVPTLSQWGLALLSALLGLFAAWRVRRQA